MYQNSAKFRFYAELNDFLPLDKQKTLFTYHFNGKPSIKDAIEALGVPHTEVDLILVNGQSVSFEHHLYQGDHVSVYPVFEGFDITETTKLRKNPLRKTCFILDVHLGKLARLLRMLGFDTRYRNDYEDKEIIDISIKENRIILTRDRGILKTGSVTHGYWIRSTKPIDQIKEVLNRFDLYSQINPLNRCITCNGLIEKVDKTDILQKLKKDTASYFNEFYRCINCGKIYWQGSHYDNMKKKIKNIVAFSNKRDRND